jgi:amino acid adenylation domain-containing protein
MDDIVRARTDNIISGNIKIAASQNIKERDYWLNKLSGDLVKSFFPYDRKETAGNERRLDTLNFQLRGELFSNLMRLSNNSDNRLHMIFAAGLAILLHKYTGNHDIIIGMPVLKQKTEGDFINRVLPLRNKLEPGMTFKQLLLQVRQTIFEAVEHQNYPMKALLYKLNIPSQGSFSLFDAAALLENIHDKNYLKSINYNMLFSFLRTAETAAGTLEYNSSLYEKTTIRRIAGHFQRLFQVVFSDPDMRLADIDIVPEEEKRQLLVDFNNTHAAYPTDKTIHQLLEEQVEKTPGKTAVIYNDQYLTYGALNEKANRLARLLREKGVKPRIIVGILLEPSLEMILSIVGIIKAGGAYLPIDPGYPAKRISSIYKDSGALIFLCGKNTINTIAIPGKAPQTNTPGVLLLDLVWQDSDRCSEANPAHVNQPGDLLYLISTSGSTGVPKSLMMEHRNLTNLLYFQFFETGVDFRRVLQFASIGFDVSSQEIFSALLAGGELYLMDSDTKRDVYRLLELMGKNYLNVIYWPPAFLKYVFSEAAYRARFPRSVEHIITAGEQLIISESIRGHIKENHIYVHNHYGPAETHVVTTFTIDPTGDIPEIPAIGKPISNTRIYILDENKNVKPVGTIGELYISGVNVGRGYHREKELTAEKFIPDPFVKGERMYRTGDLARWLPDGNIEFIGRVDYQVKIRGYRIELGEIESRLMEIDVIKEAVVVDYGDPAGEKFLCAYIVSEKKADITEIKNRLSNDLPDYMIPLYFVPMEKIPVTPNGKVDKKALPMPKHEADKTYAAPRDKVEEELTRMWSEVLDLDKETIGIDDDFFKLGGHSLKATILITRIHKAFDVNVTLGELFRQPTIRRWSELIKSTGYDIFSAIAPMEMKEYYPLSSAQKRIYILQHMQPETISYNNAAIQVLQGDLEKEKFAEILQGLIKRHESLRTSFEMIDEQPVQRVHEDVEFTLEYNEIPEEEVKKRIPGFIRPFDLCRAPLLRVELIKVRGKKHILMYDLHHIITDGTSMQVFVREFMALYGGKRLSPLRIQYKDFSGWQNRLFESGKIRDQQEYWLKQFEGEIPVLNMPTDYPRPEIRHLEGSAVVFDLGSDVTGALNELAGEHSATLYMVLLALFNVLLAKLSGQEDVIIGTYIAGRRHADLHFIIGMFVNTLVMRNHPVGEKTFSEFLDEVRGKTLAAFENQDYPFEELTEKIAVNRDTSRNPLFDVMFGLQNMTIQTGQIPEAQIPALEVQPYAYDNDGNNISAARFDLTLAAVEIGRSLSFICEYSTRLFKKETIQRFITYFKQITNGIIENADKKISDIDIIPGEEKKRLLVDFNRTESNYPKDKTIYELFEEQVEKTPEKIAAVGDGSVTYAELHQKSDQVAHVLKEKGVLADSIIGIKMERSVEMIIGVLGILKAGSAYLPIDPDYPQERIDYMLKDSSAKLLVTNKNLEEVPNFLSSQLPNFHLSPAASLAYVIYTSGTTGRPRGTLVQHRSLVNLCYWHNRYYGVTENDQATQYASFCFDASVWEIFPYLIKGAALHIIGEDIKLDIRQLADYYEKHHITISFLPTQMCQHFMEEAGKIASLRYLLTGGDRLNRFVEGDYRLYNNYGPTENTVVTTSCPVEASKENIPIGSPIDNSRVYILNKDNLQLQPIGAAGELCTAGDTLARGYLNRPELTAERFINQGLFLKKPPLDPAKTFDKKAILTRNTNTLYRTGDLARWRPDGNIEFLGRIDQQVKIRGFRIEPGEIEARLLAVGAIKEAVVIDRENKAGEKYLCAYIVSEETIDPTEIKEVLSQKLPGYMIPDYYMQLDQIPLTRSGKVNKNNLPHPGFIAPEVYVAPTDEIEEKLAEIWSEVLDIEKETLSVKSNFFDIGGNSLRLITINKKIKELLGNEISITTMFRLRTIRELAAFIRKEEIDLRVSDEIFIESVNAMDEALSFWEEDGNV